jgi:hypothetical protein
VTVRRVFLVLSLSSPFFFSCCNHIAIWTRRICAPGAWIVGRNRVLIFYCVTKISGVCRSGSFLSQEEENRHNCSSKKKGTSSPQCNLHCRRILDPHLWTLINYCHNNANLLHMCFLLRQCWFSKYKINVNKASRDWSPSSCHLSVKFFQF